MAGIRERRGQPAAKQSGGKGKVLSLQSRAMAKGKATLSCYYAMPCHFDKFMTAGVPVSSSLPVFVPGPLPSPTLRLTPSMSTFRHFILDDIYLIGALSYTRRGLV